MNLHGIRPLLRLLLALSVALFMACSGDASTSSPSPSESAGETSRPTGSVSNTTIDAQPAGTQGSGSSSPGAGQRPAPAPCQPSCTGVECGDDGCGGSCGSCPEAAPFCSGGLCATSCVPQCSGRECGDDGCGGSCGLCGADLSCSGDGICVSLCGDGLCASSESCATCASDCGDCPGGECTDTCESLGYSCGEICGQSCGSCAAGQTCTEGSCEGSSATACWETGCPPGMSCQDDGTCAEAGCMETGCPAGQSCDPESGSCEALSAPGGVCAPCSSDSECAPGWSCTALSSGKACLEGCASNDACDTGWSCVGTPALCTPDLSFSCAGCVAEGCPNGGACDPASGECASPSATCASCNENWECGPGAACVSLSSGWGKICAPRCDPNAPVPCADEVACVMDWSVEINVCMSCEATLTCGGSKPIAFQGECVECTDDSHCSAGESCDLETMGCVDPNAECGQCAEPYPTCLDLQGDTYCVQCTEDSHCAGGCTCDTSLYACTGNCVASGAEECTPGDNSTCPDHPDYTLICHESGLCVADSGGCDGVTAHCPFDNPCVSTLDLALGGTGGGQPGGLPLPGGGSGGAGVTGVCACTPNGEQDPSSDDCPGDVQCAALDLLGTGSAQTVCSTLTCEEILTELLGPLAAIICAGL